MNNIFLSYEPDLNKLQLAPKTPLNAYYSPEVLSFQIPRKIIKPGVSFFVVFENENKVRDVVELIESGTLSASGKYSIYQIPATTKLKIRSGATDIAIVIVDENEVFTKSIPLTLRLDIENYEFSYQIALARTLNMTISNYYEKIVELLMKLSEKGENNYGSKDN